MINNFRVLPLSAHLPKISTQPLIKVSTIGDLGKELAPLAIPDQVWTLIEPNARLDGSIIKKIYQDSRFNVKFKF